MLAIPFCLLAPIVLFGDITGGHFNPAVTLAVFITLGEYAKNIVFMVMIMISQFLGGMLAIGLVKLGQIGSSNPNVAFIAPVNLATGKTDMGNSNGHFTEDLPVCINEVLCTFVFISVILMIKGQHTAGDRKGLGAAMTVVLTLLACIAATGKFGGAFNPAVGLTLTTNGLIYLGHQHYIYHYLYAYTLGPLLGGLLAGFFHLVHAPAHKTPDSTRDFDASQKETLLYEQ